MPLPRRLLPALLLSLVLGPASVAHATGELTQKPGTAACISETGSNGACQDGRVLYGPSHVIVSPNGRHVYAAGMGSRSVAIFDRDASGALTQSGCISQAGGDGCAKGSGLGDAGHLAFAPDGRTLYVSGDRSIAVLDRDPATGGLAQKPGKPGCVTADGSGGACDKATAFDNVKAVAVSSDGRSAYAASLGADAVVVFDRDAAGALTQKPGKAGCLSADGTGGACEKVPAVGGAVHLALTADGRSAYVAGTDLAALAILDRDPATGELTSAGCVSHDGSNGACRDGGGFGIPYRVVIGPGDRTVYAGAGAIASFERDAASRALTQRPGLALGAYDLALSPDGLSLYAAQTLDGILRIADRDPAGGLTDKPGPAGCVTPTGSAGACRVGIGTDTPAGVAVSGDGRNVYVAGLTADAIAVFDRAAPVPAPAPPPAPSSRPPAADRLAPAVSGIKVTRRARVRFTLSEAAAVRIVIERVRGGRVRTLRVAGRPGRNLVRLRRALAPGRYRATITATDAAGNRSAARRARFR